MVLSTRYLYRAEPRGARKPGTAGRYGPSSWCSMNAVLHTGPVGEVVASLN